MTNEYGSFQCKVCGEVVLLPLGNVSSLAQPDGKTIELTCRNGHTDTYTAANFQKLPPSSLRPPKVRRAVAGIG